MSSQTPDFSKGASGPGSVYDTSPSGLGLAPSYLGGGAVATATATNNTFITGIIPALGTTPTAGTGFTYTHTNATGTYVFTFDTAFSATPTVVVTGSTFGHPAAITALSATGFTVELGPVGSHTDQIFTFIAATTV